MHIKVNTNKKIEQILKQFEKEKESCELFHINQSEKLPSTTAAER